MKNKKRLLLAILSMAVCGCTAAACGGKNEKITTEQGEENVLTGKYVMNGLNNIDDMYRIRIIDVEYDYKGLFSVTNQKEYIKGGEGSLHIEIEQCRAYPELQFRPQDTDIPQMDVSDLKNFSAWVYNANEDVSKITMNILHNDGTNLLSQEFELAAGAWTECVMPVNAVVTKYLKEDIYGFSLGLQQTGKMEFYIDEISAEFGKVFSEDDNAVMAEIDSLTGAINDLSDSVSADDEQTLLQLYGRYNALPELYRAAIYNYNKITEKMSDLLNAQSRNDDLAAGAANDRPAFYFDKFYGIAHFSNAETSKNFFGYSSEIKRDGEAGTCYIQYNNDQWNYTNLRGNVIMSDYDYIEMWLFNEGEKDKAVFFGWNNRVNVPAGEWKQVILPTSCFNSTGIQIIVTSLGAAGADFTDGRLHLSQMSVHKLGSDKMYEEALDTEKLAYTGSNATLTTENDVVTVNATADGNIDLTLLKNDAHETLNVAQSFVFSVRSPKIVCIQLLNGEGAEIPADNSVQVAPGWNTFVLSSQQYNETSILRIGGLAGEEYAFRYGYAVRSIDMQAMRLLIERDNFGAAQNVTVNELPQLLEYLNIYNSTNFAGLYTQLVKASSDANGELYKEQIAEYERICEDLNALAEKAEQLLRSLIDALKSGEGTVDDFYLLESVYKRYTETELCADLAPSEIAAAEKLFVDYAKFPKRIADVSDGSSRATFSVDNSAYNWSGTIGVATDADEGEVMEISVTSHSGCIDIGYDNGVNLTGYDTVRFKIKVTGADRNVYFTTKGWGMTLAKFYVTVDTWTEIVIPVDNYNSAGHIIISASGAFKIYFTDFYAYNQNTAVGLIDELPETVTLSDEAQVKAARAEVNKLSETFVEKVTNLLKLERCEAEIFDLKIEALPAASEITKADAATITEARAAYEALSDNAKGMVKEESKTKLSLCEQALIGYYAKQAETLIDALPEASAVTAEDAEAIIAARTAYEALSEEAKATIKAESKAKLSSCEGALVVVCINALPSADALEFEDGITLRTIRNMYNALTADVQSNVTNIATLAALETAFNEKYEAVVEMTEENKGYFTKPASPADWLGTNYTFGFVTDETYGNLLVMNPVEKVTQDHNAFVPGYKADATLYDTVYFYVYNGSESNKGLFVRFDGGGYNPAFMTLKPGWNKVEMAVEQFNALNILGIGSVSQTSAVYKFSSFYGLKNEYLAAKAEALIEKLPQPADVTDADVSAITAARAAYEALSDNAKGMVKEESKTKLSLCEQALIGYYAKQAETLIDALPEASAVTAENAEAITEARTVYEELSEEAKAIVKAESKDKLASCEGALVVVCINALPLADALEFEDGITLRTVRNMYNALTAYAQSNVTNIATLAALETAFNGKFEVVVEMTAEDNGYLARPASWLGTNYTPGYSTDETYGNLIVMNPVANVTQDHNAFECTLTDALDATQYDRVYFYVYNGSTSDKGLFVRFGDGALNTSFMTLTPGWNKVEMTIEQFNTLNLLGIGLVNQTSAVYKFSSIYAAKKSFQPKRIADVSESSSRETFSVDNSAYNWSGTIGVATDADEGEVMEISVTSHSGCIDIGYDNGVNLTGYDTVRFKIKVTGADRNVYFTTKGWGMTLAKFYVTVDTWTEIVIPVDNYNSAGHIIISASGAFKIYFTDFCAYNENTAIGLINELPETVTLSDAAQVETARAEVNKLSEAFVAKVINIKKLENCEVQLAIAAIDNLPAVSEVEPYHKTAIDKVRAACNSLTDDQLSKVTNYETLTALETAFNEKFEVVVEMTAEDNGYLARPASWLGTNYTLGYDTDETYGNLIVMNPVANVTQDHNAFECTLTDALDATQYDRVYFYVYNGSTSDKGLFVRFGDGALNTSFMTLTPGWNKVEMTIEQFNTLNLLGIGLVNQTSAVYKFSDIYAVKKTSAG